MVIWHFQCHCKRVCVVSYVQTFELDPTRYGLHLHLLGRRQLRDRKWFSSFLLSSLSQVFVMRGSDVPKYEENTTLSGLIILLMDWPRVAVTGHQIEEMGAGDVKWPSNKKISYVYKITMIFCEKVYHYGPGAKNKYDDIDRLIPVWIVHVLLGNFVRLRVDINGMFSLRSHVILPDDATLLSYLKFTFSA